VSSISTHPERFAPMPFHGSTPAPGRLGGREWRRRLWHMLPGALPFALWPFPHRDPLSPVLRDVMLVVGAAIGLCILVMYRGIRRSDEDRHQLAAVAGYLFSVVVPLALFPGAPELGLTVLAILAFGDGSATLFGLLLGGPKLPWNARKTWSGFVGFVVVGTVMAAAVYWGESHNLEARPPIPPFSTALAIAAAATLAAAVAESIPARLNDNIRVGVVAGVVVVGLHTVLVGWPG